MTKRSRALVSAPFCYDYPRPAVATDIVVFTLRCGALHVLLIKRGLEPFAGKWALPGGFLLETETLDECAARELAEETGLTAAVLEQCAIFSAPGRDPRGRFISVAYGALVPSGTVSLKAGTDAAEADWFPVDDLPEPLAFDHAKILSQVHAHFVTRVEQDLTLLFAFLADRKHFTLRALHLIYEAVTRKRYDRANFRRRVRQDNLPIVPLGEAEAPIAHERGVRHRPAQYYRVVGGAE